MDIFILVHKLALLISIVIGIMIFIQKKEIFIKLHRWIGCATVLGMVGYIISTRFDSIGYVIYTGLFLLTFILPMVLKNKIGKLSHIGVMVVAFGWLFYIH